MGRINVQLKADEVSLVYHTKEGIPAYQQTNFPDHGFQKLELTDTQTNRRDRTYYHLPRRMRRR